MQITFLFSVLRAVFPAAVLLLSLLSVPAEHARAAAVAEQAAQQQKADAAGTLIFAGENISTLNPLLNAHDELPSLIFSGLTSYDGAGRVQPDLAESFTFDADTLTYTFKLRPGVRWHDGTPFDAGDVVFTYRLLLSEAGRICPVQSNYADIQSVQATDDLTVRIRLREKNAAMAGYLSMGILPEHLLAGKDVAMDAFNQHPVGTGRYRFVSWDRAGGRIELAVNRQYYAKVPEIERILYCTTGDESAKSLQLQSGQADLAWLNAHYAEEFRHKAGFYVRDFSSADLRAIAFDFRTKFWQDNRDSTAVLNYAIDKEALVQAVLAGHGSRAFSPLQFSPLCGSTGSDLYPYDLKKFAEAMAKLGWVKGEDGIYTRRGQPFAFRVQVREYEQERMDLARICSAMLQQAGVRMEVVPVMHFDWQAGYEAYLWGFAAPFDPDELYSSTVTGMSDNIMAYSNKEADRLLTAGRRTADPKERSKIYAQFEQVYAADPACVPLVYLEGNYAASEALQGLNTQRVLGHHAAGVFWNAEEWTLHKGKVQEQE